MSIPSFVPRSDVVKKERKKEQGRRKIHPFERVFEGGMLGAVNQKKKKKEMTRHCRGMNVPRIEDRGLRNSKLNFHPSFARLKNFMPNFIFHISIIVSERKNSSSIKLSSKSFFLFFNNHRISSLKKKKRRREGNWKQTLFLSS